MSEHADLAAETRDRFPASHDIIVAARQNLRQAGWDYVCGGAETETRLRRNRQALDSLAFRPRVLRDVSSVDTCIDFLGHKMAIPVMLAPIGGLQAWGLAAAAGVVRVLEIIQNEIEISMGLLGVAQVDQLGPAYLTQGTTVRLPHEMSAFPHLPVDRLE